MPSSFVVVKQSSKLRNKKNSNCEINVKQMNLHKTKSLMKQKKMGLFFMLLIPQ